MLLFFNISYGFIQWELKSVALSSSFLLVLCNLEETGSLKGSAHDTLTQLFMGA